MVHIRDVEGLVYVPVAYLRGLVVTVPWLLGVNLGGRVRLAGALYCSEVNTHGHSWPLAEVLMPLI